jgi:alkyl hydroperoxide reductase subunit AhpC
VFCKGQLVQLQKDLPLFKKAGLGLAAISYDSPEILADFAARRNITFPLLSDHDSRVIREYDVLDRRYTSTKAVIQVESTDGWQSFGTAALSDTVPAYGLSDAAVFLLNPKQEIQWRLVSESETRRLTGAAILEHSLGTVTEAIKTEVDSGKIPIELTASNKEVGTGDRIVLGIDMKIPPGLHVYGPTVTGGYHGTEWEMETTKCARSLEPEYPEPVTRKFEFAEETLPIFEGNIRMSRELLVAITVNKAQRAVIESFAVNCLDESGRMKIKGMLKFQACDDKECFPPQAVPLEWKLDFTSPDGTRVPSELWRVFTK